MRNNRVRAIHGKFFEWKVIHDYVTLVRNTRVRARFAKIRYF